MVLQQKDNLVEEEQEVKYETKYKKANKLIKMMKEDKILKEEEKEQEMDLKMKIIQINNSMVDMIDLKIERMEQIKEEDIKNDILYIY